MITCSSYLFLAEYLFIFVFRCYPWEGTLAESPFKTCKRRFGVNMMDNSCYRVIIVCLVTFVIKLDFVIEKTLTIALPGQTVRDWSLKGPTAIGQN